MGRYTRKIAIAAAAPLAVAMVALATTTASAASVVVNPGNTLSGIASEYNTSVSDLVSLNNINNPNLIFPGQVINTGGGGDSTPPASSAAPAAAPVQSAPQSAPVQSQAQPQASSDSSDTDSSCLANIAQAESTDNPNAVNPSSGTYGLFQFLPGTGPGAGASVSQQYAAAHSYAVARYGGDCQAWAFHEANGWW